MVFNILAISTLLSGAWRAEPKKSWLRFFGTGIQPAEVVKVTFVVLLAKQLKSRKESGSGLNSIASVSLLILHFAFMFMLIVVSSNDLGSALVFAVIFAVMLFAAGISLVWFFLGIVIVGAVSPLIWNSLLSDYQKERILAPYFPKLWIPPAGASPGRQTRAR